MWKLDWRLVLLAAVPATGAIAQAPPQDPQHQQLRAAVMARPAATASTDASARATAPVRSAGTARLDATHRASLPSQDVTDLRAQGKSPPGLLPAREEEVDVDFTFDSADPLDGRFSADRPGLMGLKGKVRF